MFVRANMCNLLSSLVTEPRDYYYLVTENTQSKGTGLVIFSKALLSCIGRVNGDVTCINTRIVTFGRDDKNSSAPQIEGAQSVAVTKLR